MDIYVDRLPLDTFRRRKVKPDGIYTLAGVNVSTSGGEVSVEPVYAPLLTCQRFGRQSIIQYKSWLIVTQSWWPFLHVERADCLQLGDE